MNEAQSRQTGLQAPLAQDFCIGEWRVMPALNQLKQVTGSGQERHLEPRLMRLLCSLAANRDRVLTREELIAELWPNVIVNENSLTRAISALRKQLESGDEPGRQYLQTISKRGYRLIAETYMDSTPTAAPLARVFHLHGKTRRLMATAASLVLAMLIFQLPANAPSGIPPAEHPVYDRVINSAPDFAADLVTLSGAHMENLGDFKPAEQGAVEKAVLSNDGVTLAFIRYDNNGSTVFLGNIDTTQAPVAVFNSKNYLYNLGWSPVGKALLFASRPLGRTAAIRGNQLADADLVMLNLETLEVKVLLDSSGKQSTQAPVSEINLT